MAELSLVATKAATRISRYLASSIISNCNQLSQAYRAKGGKLDKFVTIVEDAKSRSEIQPKKIVHKK